MEALEALRNDLITCHALEDSLRGKGKNGKQDARARTVPVILEECQSACAAVRKRVREEEGVEDLSDAGLCKQTRFTDSMGLGPYARFLWYVPRLVNCVTLAEALPVPGSGLKLPLDLRHIASRCAGAYYAPRRFAAVQLAYSSPRCRVLVFHTGRLVGTGCSGSGAARLAIARAQRQLAEEANIHIFIRCFSVINQVGAVSLRASLNCEGFASAHSSSSHFDRASFVGLAWRPPNEKICCEIYSTGRANLPGSVAERQCVDSFSRMLPELLRFSSAAHLLKDIPKELQDHHRSHAISAEEAERKSQGLLIADNKTARTARAAKADRILAPAMPLPEEKEEEGLWAGWGDAAEVHDDAIGDVDGAGLDLGALGM